MDKYNYNITMKRMSFKKFWNTIGKRFSEDEEVTSETMDDGNTCVLYRDECGTVIGVWDCEAEMGGFAWEN